MRSRPSIRARPRITTLSSTLPSAFSRAPRAIAPGGPTTSRALMTPAPPRRRMTVPICRYLAAGDSRAGVSTPPVAWEAAGRRYVLRRNPPGKLLPSAHAVDREFRVISALHAQRFPFAEPVLYCEDAGIAGTPFYVMKFVDGRVLWEPHMPNADPRERAAVY